MEEAKQYTDKRDGELSLKELIIKAGEWISYLRSKWLIIGLFAIVGASLGLLYSYFTKPKYTAELTFVLEESKSGSMGSYAGIASQLGIDLPGMSTSGSGVFSADNILAFLKSRLMVERALLAPMEYKGKTVSMANAYIDIKGLRKSWVGHPELANLNFDIQPDRSKFTRAQDSVLGALFEMITLKELTVDKPDKKISFIYVKNISPDENFAKAFTERLVTEATSFYVATKMKSARTNVDRLSRKADSLLELLNKKTYSYASKQDLNLNPVRKIASVGADLDSRDKSILQTMYGEVVKNLEISRMSMEQETPIIQIIDGPILPLAKQRAGKMVCILIGGIVGGFLISFFLLIRKIYGQLMA